MSRPISRAPPHPASRPPLHGALWQQRHPSSQPRVHQHLPAHSFLHARLRAQELPGLTDEEKPRMRGPKRASKIRKLFNLSKVRDTQMESM